ncbi:hypothetical protein [Devosia sp. ZB163]|uniref:hypothetical protein n=1 Tax=Devosia sp. ZB163 TaxID=3025938 RepID=UPI003FCE8C6C
MASAREGADVAISYLNEHEGAQDAKRGIEGAGRRCLLLPGGRSIIERPRRRSVASMSWSKWRAVARHWLTHRMNKRMIMINQMGTPRIQSPSALNIPSSF